MLVLASWEGNMSIQGRSRLLILMTCEVRTKREWLINKYASSTGTPSILKTLYRTLGTHKRKVCVECAGVGTDVFIHGNDSEVRLHGHGGYSIALGSMLA
jgi:hypothetical protein